MENAFVLPKNRFNDLLQALKSAGFVTIAPRVKDGAVVLDRLDSADQLPIGYRDEQAPGTYRLRPSGTEQWFAFVCGPYSLRRFLMPPETKLVRVDFSNGQPVARAADLPEVRYAFIGVRACDLAAVAIQNKVFIDRQGRFTDPVYERLVSQSLFIGVQCQIAADTCFCAAMGTGPHIRSGADAVLTELEDGFLVYLASDRAEAIFDQLDLPKASQEQISEAEAKVDQAASSMQRTVPAGDLRDLLLGNLESDHWQQVAERCMACGNCTMVCPTCFCFAMQDRTDLAGVLAERCRYWDSCFNPDFSYAFGTTVRRSVAARYRHWLTHKFASWCDQFGVTGCVGCGRCITWCPAGIDVTAELEAVVGSAGSKGNKR